MKFPVNEPAYTGKTDMSISEVMDIGFNREVDAYWNPVAQAIMILVDGKWQIVKLKDLVNDG